MIRQISIKNFKSIVDHTIELGRINVFIGENGSGKSNILEAVATASAASERKLSIEELYARGVRIAKPSITISSFLKVKPEQKIEFGVAFTMDEPTHLMLRLSPENPDDINTGWRIESSPSNPFHEVTRLLTERPEAIDKRILRVLAIDGLRFHHVLAGKMGGFCIYNLNPLALRGIHVVSRRAPLGIHGENLDVFLASFDKKQLGELLRYGQVISWLDKLVLDTEDKLKFQGHKLGRSVSTLYFRDRFMRKNNNIFSAENANEGILHILFYLALFLSEKTPSFFGIDNIETALNPQLCRELMKSLAALAKEHDKQALITTHNPAILDGLNLHDDDQRLFVVYRNDQGHTVTKRIKLKPDTGESKYKLSELWMRGHLGGLPRTF
jgi:predicted ATPase